MKIKDKELNKVNGGFEQGTAVVYSFEEGDCFGVKFKNVYKVLHSYEALRPDEEIQAFFYRYDSFKGKYVFESRRGPTRVKDLLKLSKD